MKRTLVWLGIVLVLVIGGGAYAYATDAALLDRFYSPEQRAAREVARLTKEFPKLIENYALYRRGPEKIQINAECLPAGGAELCLRTVIAEYRQTDGPNVIFVHMLDAPEKSQEQLRIELVKQSHPDSLGGYGVVRVENHELGWFPVAQYDFILTQEGKYAVHADGSEIISYPSRATGGNPVTKYFLEKYPPKP